MRVTIRRRRSFSLSASTMMAVAPLASSRNPSPASTPNARTMSAATSVVPSIAWPPGRAATT
jgi:hypothetical protein